MTELSDERLRNELAWAVQGEMAAFIPDDYEESWLTKASFAIADALLAGKPKAFRELFLSRRASPHGEAGIDPPYPPITVGTRTVGNGEAGEQDAEPEYDHPDHHAIDGSGDVQPFDDAYLGDGQTAAPSPAPTVPGVTGVAALDELVRLVEADVFGPETADDPDEESVGWTGDGKPLPMTFGHVRRARNELERIRSALVASPSYGEAGAAVHHHPDNKPSPALDNLVSAVARQFADDTLVKHMIDRFLSWPLPTDFNPDGGISFEPLANKGTEYEYPRSPSGTNLFDWEQADAMVRHMLEGAPVLSPSPQGMEEARKALQDIVDDWEQARRGNPYSVIPEYVHENRGATYAEHARRALGKGGE